MTPDYRSLSHGGDGSQRTTPGGWTGRPAPLAVSAPGGDAPRLAAAGALPWCITGAFLHVASATGWYTAANSNRTTTALRAGRTSCATGWAESPAS
jgi:hypothetical protein